MKDRVTKPQLLPRLMRAIGFFPHVYRYKHAGYRRCQHCGRTEIFHATAFHGERTGWTITRDAVKPRRCRPRHPIRSIRRRLGLLRQESA